MEIAGGDYESCKNMIYKLALERFNINKKNRTDVEFDDVLSEAYCIYAQCLTTFEGDKGMKFTTYLYQNLVARLRDYYEHSHKKLLHYEDFNFSNNHSGNDTFRFEDNLVSPDYNIDLMNNELLELAEKELSYEAIVTLKYILSRKWETKTKRTFPKNSVLANRLGYTPEIMDSIMNELKSFWNNKGVFVA